MNRDEVLEMARQCKALTGFESEIEFIERFAALVAERTREECARVCDVASANHIDGGQIIAAAIRSMT